MTVALKPFQQDDVQWLLWRLNEHRAAFLWNDMGTGKTAEMIAAAKARQASSILITCPAIARDNWCREIDKWDGQRLPVFATGIHGDIPPSSPGYVIVNYDRIRDGNGKLLDALRRPWALALIDEHQYIANPEAQRTNHFYNANGNRLAGHFGKVILASGTPMRQSPLDIWCHYQVWAPDNISRMSMEDFKDRYTVSVTKRIPNGAEIETIVSGRNEDELMGRIAGTYRRTRRQDVFDQLPPLMILPWWLPVHGRALEQVDKLADILDIDPFDDAEAVADVLEREEHQQVVISVQAVSGLLHAEYVVQLLPDLTGKVLLFAHHVVVLDSLMEKLTYLDMKPVAIRGGQTASQRQAAVDRFQHDAACRAAVIQLQVGATAVSMTAASDIIFVQLDWTATNNVQCIARAYARLNDPHAVTVRIVMSDDWLAQGQARVIARRLHSINSALPGTIEHALVSALNGQTATATTIDDFFS